MGTLSEELDKSIVAKNNIKNALEIAEPGSTTNKTFLDYHTIIKNFSDIKKFFENDLIDVNVTYWIPGKGMQPVNIKTKYSIRGGSNIVIDLNAGIFKSIGSDIEESDSNEYWNPNLKFTEFVSNFTIENDGFNCFLIIPIGDIIDDRKIFLGAIYENIDDSKSTYLNCNLYGTEEAPTDYFINLKGYIRGNSVKIYEKTDVEWKLLYEGLLDNDSLLSYKYTCTETKIKQFRIESTSTTSLGDGEKPLFESPAISYGIISVFSSNIHNFNNKAFLSCKNLVNVLMTKENIGIPKFQNIPTNCFSDCVSLNYIVIPSRINYLNNYCFKQSGIKSFFLSNIDTSIHVEDPNSNTFGNECFYACENLTTISLPLTKQLGNSVLNGCQKLSYVDIPIVTILGQYCFKKCYDLKNISLPLATQLGNFCFQECGLLFNINIPKVTVISQNCFENCLNIVNIDLPEVIILMSNCFAYCTNLKGLNVPKVSDVQSDCLIGCISLTILNFPELNNLLYGGLGFLKNLEIIDLPKITNLGDNCFNGFENLLIISLPKAINLGETCFRNCKNLVEVNLPLVESLGINCFSGCSNLQTVNIPKIITLGGGCFFGCSNLQKVNIYNVTLLDEYTFFGCINLSTIDLPLVNTIGVSAFENCLTLRTIRLGNNIVTLDDKCFSRCINLERIDLTNITKLGNECFGSCSNLQTIYLPNATEVGSSCFASCTNLRIIDLPIVNKLGNNCFDSCSNLQTIYLPNATEVGSSCFANCLILQTINLLNVNKLGNNCFQKCSNLQTVYLPNVTTLSYHCFQFCPKLRYYIFDSKTPPTLEDLNSLIIIGNQINTKIFVPNLSLNAYKTATNWVSFSNSIFPINEFYLEDYPDTKTVQITYYKQKIGYTTIERKIPYTDNELNLKNLDCYEKLKQTIQNPGNTLKKAYWNPTLLFQSFTSPYEIVNEKIDLTKVTSDIIPIGVFYEFLEDTKYSNMFTLDIKENHPKVPNKPNSFLIKSNFYVKDNNTTISFYYIGSVDTEFILLRTIIYPTSGNYSYTWEDIFTTAGVKSILIKPDKQICIGNPLSDVPEDINNKPEHSFMGDLTPGSRDSLVSAFLTKSTYLGRNAFNGCLNLKNVVLTNMNYNNYYSWVFNGCQKLKNIILNKNSMIGNNTFANCFSLKNIVFSYYAGDNNIQTECFANCNNLENIILPINTKLINPRIFRSCYNLKNNFIITDNFIQNEVFNMCRNMTKIEIKNQLEFVGMSALGITNIREFSAVGKPDGSSIIQNYAFQECFKLQKVSLDNFSIIRVSSFKNCRKLKSIELKGTKIIEDNVFEYTYNLETIKFPSTLTSLGDKCFIGSGVINYIFESTTPPTLFAKTSLNINTDTKIYVPNASLNAYKTATNWVLLANYIFPMSSLPDWIYDF